MSSPAPPPRCLLDISMPGMDGLQVLERIRDLSDVPVLRRKLREAAGVEPLQTVRGFGYRYNPERWPRQAPNP
jgi:DNA-binding response OmpR family regulator